MIESSICALVFASAVNPANVALYLPLLMGVLLYMLVDNIRNID